MEVKDFDNVIRVISSPEEICCIKNDGTMLRFYIEHDYMEGKATIETQLVDLTKISGVDFKIREAETKNEIIKELDRMKMHEIKLRDRLNKLG